MPTTRRVLRALVAGALTLGLVLVFLLDPTAVRVYATDMMGSLRAPGDPAFVAGHRGDRADAPENTLPAFRFAIAHGLDFVETDVQLTADGVPVLLHDPTVDRTTDGTGAVDRLTLAQVEKLDAGSWFSPTFAGTRIPTLAQLADLLVGVRQKAILELKGAWSPNQVSAILPIIYARGIQNRVVFAGMDIGTLAALGQAAGPFPRILISHWLPPHPQILARELGATAVLTTPAALRAAPHAIRQLHRAGVGVMLYTLDSEKTWRRAIGDGIEGIVKDDPCALHDWFGARAQSRASSSR